MDGFVDARFTQVSAHFETPVCWSGLNERHFFVCLCLAIFDDRTETPHTLHGFVAAMNTVVEGTSSTTGYWSIIEVLP